MTVFAFIFVGMFLVLSWMLFLIFGLSFAVRVMLLTDAVLVILLFRLPFMFKIEEYPVATIGTYLYIIVATIAPIIIHNHIDRHTIFIIAIIEILLIAVLLTVNYKDFDKEIPERVHVETDEQHATVESSDWV